MLINADCAYGFPFHTNSNLDTQKNPGTKHGSAAPQSLAKGGLVSGVLRSAHLRPSVVVINSAASAASLHHLISLLTCQMRPTEQGFY